MSFPVTSEWHRPAAGARRSRLSLGQCPSPLLPLMLQIGPARVEHATPELLRITAGTDQPAVLRAIRQAGGCLDGTRRFWWLPVRALPRLEGELRALADPLFAAKRNDSATSQIAVSPDLQRLLTEHEGCDKGEVGPALG